MKQDYINSSTILNCNSLSSIYDLEVGGSVIASNAIIIFVDIWSSLYSLQTQVNGKQDLLTAGTNITIYGNNIISSSGSGSDITQEYLDLKHDILTYNNDLVLNSIVVKPKFTKEIYTEALDGEKKSIYFKHRRSIFRRNL